MSAMLAKAPMTMPAIAPPEIDDEPPELARAVVLDEDEPDADAEAETEVEELRIDVEGANIPKNVCASVSMPISPAQQSFLVPQHHFVEFAVSSHGVIRTLLLAYYMLISSIIKETRLMHVRCWIGRHSNNCHSSTHRPCTPHDSTV